MTSMNIPLLFISGPEIMIVLLLVVMLFGADKIPEIARAMGKGIRQVKNATNDIKQEIKDSADKSEAFKDLKDGVEESKKEIDEITGSVKRNLRL